MKDSHRKIIDKLEEYFEQEGAEHLRFWQGCYNVGLIESDLINEGFVDESMEIRDDYELEDKDLLKRLKIK